MRKTGKKKPCSVCETMVYRAAWQDRARPTVYCSRKCYELWWSFNLPGREATSGSAHRSWKGGKLEKHCLQCRRQFMVPRNYQADRRFFCSNACYGHFYSGERSHLWRGGIASERSLSTKRAEYRRWKVSVFKRDRYTCVACLVQVNLEAHHLKPYAEFPELRLDTENGVTLCAKCHPHTYKNELLFVDILRDRILRDFTSDTRESIDLAKIKSVLLGDKKRSARRGQADPALYAW